MNSKQSFCQYFQTQLEELQNSGLYKTEKILTSPQSALIQVDERQMINFCANNYLGLANHPELVETARNAVSRHGFGLSSVRFICGTQDLHKELEKKISSFLETQDTILYSSCWDANGGLFETLLGPEDAVISDALNHASIIDGIRLCKATRFRYENNDMSSLEEQLKAAQSYRYRLIATDGVFSMDGVIASLDQICMLAEKYSALVMVDDSHAVGFLGEKGKGSIEYRNVLGKIDLITGTLGKALGGASGGYTSGKKEIIEWLRQKSRPYLFSNSLAPVIVKTSLKALELIQAGNELRKRLQDNTKYFRSGLERLKFSVIPGEHPILPVMLFDEKIASKMAERLMQEGIYLISFSYPVVPKGKARIRIQISAIHTKEEMNAALAAFEKVGKELQII